jgi:hypothetical protein
MILDPPIIAYVKQSSPAKLYITGEAPPYTGGSVGDICVVGQVHL